MRMGRYIRAAEDAMEKKSKADIKKMIEELKSGGPGAKDKKPLRPDQSTGGGKGKKGVRNASTYRPKI